MPRHFEESDWHVWTSEKLLAAKKPGAVDFLDLVHNVAAALHCKSCDAYPGAPCQSLHKQICVPHSPRIKAAKRLIVTGSLR